MDRSVNTRYFGVMHQVTATLPFYDEEEEARSLAWISLLLIRMLQVLCSLPIITAWNLSDCFSTSQVSGVGIMIQSMNERAHHFVVYIYISICS